MPGGLTLTRITDISGQQLAYQASDPHGTNLAQIDATTLAVTRRPSDPFGNDRGTPVDPASWAGDKGFVGGTRDDATGLTNLGAREYDPVHGRFLNPDPLLDEANPQQWNGYAYAGNTPVNASDPSGLIFGIPCYETGDCDHPAGRTPGDGGAVENHVTTSEYSGTPLPHSTTPSNGNGSGGTQPKKKHCGRFDFGCKIKKAASTANNWVNEHATQILVTVAVVAVVVGAAMCITATAGGCAAVLATAAEGALAGAEAGGVAGAVMGASTAVIAEGAAAAAAAIGVGAGAAAAAAAKAAGAESGAAARTPEPAGKVSGGNGKAESAAEPAPATKSTSRGPSCNSFPASTGVVTVRGGSKPISDIKVGDQVEATDPQTGETAPRTVTNVIVTPDDEDYTDLTVHTADGDHTITSTQHHPYWDDTTKTWTNATDLKPGDKLRQPDGTTVAVLALRNFKQQVTTYNLTVEFTHTYYVLAGSAEILVHNSDAECRQLPLFVLKDGETSTQSQIAASTPGGGTRTGQAAARQRLLDAANGDYQCWRCGMRSTNPDDMHLGHKNVPTSRGGNLADDNICLEGAACNLSANNRGFVTPGMSCAERGSCGAPYGR